MSTSSLYIYIYPFSFVEPGARDPCSPLFDKHTFFNDLCSCWDIFIFLPELYDSNWGFEQLGSSYCIIEISYAIPLEPIRSQGVGGAH